MSEMESDSSVSVDPLEPYKQAPEAVKRIMKDVLALEKDMISQARPRLKNEVVNIVKEAVKDEN